MIANWRIIFYIRITQVNVQLSFQATLELLSVPASCY